MQEWLIVALAVTVNIVGLTAFAVAIRSTVKRAVDDIDEIKISLANGHPVHAERIGVHEKRLNAHAERITSHATEIAALKARET